MKRRQIQRFSKLKTFMISKPLFFLLVFCLCFRYAFYISTSKELVD
uniref:Uncharacterized protein n=1 Tax=Anguilla anguilla TaxID=7936 RepID=A0A0E9PZM7_ANGAN